MSKNKNKENEKEHNENDNANFVQLSREYTSNLGRLARKNALSVQIMMFLVESMGRTTNAVICSYKTLQELTGTSRSSVSGALKILKDDNWVQAVRVGNATAYAINEKVFWQAGRNARKYALFSATVVASETEQDSNFHEKAKEPLRHIPVVGDARPVLNSNEELPPPDQTDMDLD